MPDQAESVTVSHWQVLTLGEDVYPTAMQWVPVAQTGKRVLSDLYALAATDGLSVPTRPWNGSRASIIRPIDSLVVILRIQASSA
jgi:hypothetical protein